MSHTARFTVTVPCIYDINTYIYDSSGVLYMYVDLYMVIHITYTCQYQSHIYFDFTISAQTQESNN